MLSIFLSIKSIDKFLEFINDICEVYPPWLLIWYSNHASIQTRWKEKVLQEIYS